MKMFALEALIGCIQLALAGAESTNLLNMRSHQELEYYYSRFGRRNRSDDELNFLGQNVTAPALSMCDDSMSKCVMLAIIFGLLILFTIIGNLFVIAAIYLEKNLHSVANYLIVSLAIADLMVAIMVNFLNYATFIERFFKDMFYFVGNADRSLPGIRLQMVFGLIWLNFVVSLNISKFLI